ncbi:hypothetical protein LCGC14_2688500 [marine sediment metagenome]|uniref:Uncharacterized protein n=1 Tax=marine sediment metagenome TaxID=412755 RepID=A0A0F8ZJB5_9ZZZZ
MIKRTLLVVRLEWVERYMLRGRVHFRIHPELRRHGSLYSGGGSSGDLLLQFFGMCGEWTTVINNFHGKEENDG